MELLSKVVTLEWEMFERVKSLHPVSCQSSPDKFRVIRTRIFEQWTEEMLSAYLVQLQDARQQGRNLLAEKYARMDNLIPPLTKNPLIAKIITISERWQHEIQQAYPALFDRCCRSTEPTGDGSNFSVYLASELETYGDTVIELYYLNVNQEVERNRNMSLEALLRLVKSLGYRDLEHAEASLREGMSRQA